MTFFRSPTTCEGSSKTRWTISGCNGSTVRVADRSQTLIQSKFSISVGRRTERASAYSAAIPTPTSSCSRNPTVKLNAYDLPWLHLLGLLIKLTFRAGMVLGVLLVALGLLSLFRHAALSAGLDALHFLSLSIIGFLGPTLGRWLNRDVHFRSSAAQPGPTALKSHSKSPTDLIGRVGLMPSSSISIVSCTKSKESKTDDNSISSVSLPDWIGASTVSRKPT